MKNKNQKETIYLKSTTNPDVNDVGYSNSRMIEAGNTVSNRSDIYETH